MFLLMLAVAAVGAGSAGQSAAAEAPISLQGEWAFRLDPNKVGIEGKWFEAGLPDKIKLPGSTDEGGFGTKNTRPPDFNYLSRIVEYIGPAWYQREVAIPGEWAGRRITLFLERCHWETRVWVDDQACGMQDSLCVPHVYDLSAALTSGKHRLTIRVDNSLKYDMGRAAHSTSEQTQSNWNGIIGRIELRAAEPVWIEGLQVYPDVDRKTAKVRLILGNSTGKAVAGRVRLQAVVRDGGPKTEPRDVEFTASDSRATVETDLPMAKDVRLWDEFSGALYDLTASLAATAEERRYAGERTATFGMRKLSISDGKQIAVNGRTIFLRGTLECCIFPLTGYPPTDVGAWLRIFRIAKSYGLNHMRFHSWCPPEAAFEAADQMGFLLHVETPCWIANWGRDPKRDQFVADEAKRILAAYGNHPSFGMLCMGNEPGGDLSVIHRIVKEIKPTDPRHLYLSGAGWGFGPDDDYRVVPIRGLHGPTTDFDFRGADAKHNAPVISHEIGQWTVYPNLEEMKKYTGVLRPRNFELVRDDLAKKHMLDQAADFTRASGHLMVLLYKEEMEVLLRTPGHAGFQLLDLHDFPGQGTALVGTLDPFWDSKGLITPEAWRRFCGPTVPLLRMKKRTYTSDETFTAQAEIAHFGPAAIEQAEPVWTIKDEQGRDVASGRFAPLTLPTEKLSPLGNVEASLAKAAAPARLTVTLALKGTDIANDWEIWVYPAKVDVSPPADVVISKAWDEPTRSALAAGKKVLLLAASTESPDTLPGSFTPVFWSPIWFAGRGAGTMSILCDPKHPALARFPTEAYTNWQWYDLLQRSRSIILDETPATYRPIVQVIDNFSRNHKLGNLFEARVGKGRLLVCSIDLEKDLDQRPAARQLLHSLLIYMGSEAFKPAHELDSAFAAKLFRPSPLSEMKEEPKAMDRAVLRVKAAGKLATLDQAFRWTRENDEVLARREGFDYSVKGSIWRDSVGSAWHDGRNLVVSVGCPKGFQGKLYVHFHDWNQLGRVAEIQFQGRKIGTLRSYDGAGVWLAFPVTAKDSASGRLEVSAHPTRANVMITQIVLMENGTGTISEQRTGRSEPVGAIPSTPY
jgi:Arc/MetJ family transcription regulator